GRTARRYRGPISLPCSATAPPTPRRATPTGNGQLRMRWARCPPIVSPLMDGPGGFYPPMHICLFDIDGTLLNSGGAGKAAIEAALVEEFGVLVQVQVPYSGRTDRAIGRDRVRFHGVAGTADNWQRLVPGYLE